MKLEAYNGMFRLKWHFWNDEKEFDRNKFKPNPLLILDTKMEQLKYIWVV